MHAGARPHRVRGSGARLQLVLVNGRQVEARDEQQLPRALEVRDAAGHGGGEAEGEARLQDGAVGRRRAWAARAGGGGSGGRAVPVPAAVPGPAAAVFASTAARRHACRPAARRKRWLRAFARR
jgi:hypothetical protein